MYIRLFNGVVVLAVISACADPVEPATINTVDRQKSAGYAVSAESGGGVIFDANFNDQPIGAIATQPSTGSIPLQLPTVVLTEGTSSVTVAPPTLGFSTRSMLVDGAPFSLASGSFFNPTQIFNGQVIVEWASAIAAAPPAEAEWRIGAIIVTRTPNNFFQSILSITYNPLGSFKIAGTPDPEVTFGSYAVAQPDRFRLVLDLDAHAYSLRINGEPAWTGNLNATSGFNHLVFDNINRFSAPDFPALGVDDVRVALLTPATLENRLASIEVDQGDAGGLLNLARAAGRSIDAGRPSVAVAQLNAFIQQVRSRASVGKLNELDADALILDAQDLIAALSAK